MKRAVALAVGLALAASGCTSTTVVERINAAPEAVRSAGSATMTMRVVQSSQNLGAEAFTTEARANGVLDFASERGELRMELDLPEDVTSRGGFDVQPCEIVFEGTDVYMQMAPDRREEIGGKTWIKVDGADLAGFDVQGFAGADPSGSLSFLQGVTGDVEEVGTETIGGVETTHYRAEVEKADLLEVLEGERREQLTRQLDQLHLDRFPVDVWLDGDGLVRRMRFELANTVGATEVKVEMTMELSDLGEPVEIEIPEDVAVPENASAASGGCFGLPETPAAPAEAP